MKKTRNFAPVAVVVVCWLGLVVGAGLTLDGVKCGQRVCKRGDYCSESDRTCRPCSTVCDAKTHNYDGPLCVQDCQDYLHDARYVLKEEVGDAGENLRATVQRLSQMVTVVLTLVCFMLAALAAVLCIQLYRWKKKKNITIATIKDKLFSKKSSSNASKPPPVAEGNDKPDLRLQMPSPSSPSEHSPVTVTTSISRRPAEDSTLDYAYDNHGMASPSPTGKPNETGF